MTTSLFPFVLMPALSNVGLISPAAKLAFYLTGTTTLATVYDEDGDPISQATNGHGVAGVEADGFGHFPTIYCDDAVTYRVVLRTALGVQIGAEIDPYNGGVTASDVTFAQTGSGSVTRTVNDKLLEAPESPQDFSGSATAQFAEILNSRDEAVNAFFPSADYTGQFDVQRSGVAVSGPYGVLENDTGPLNVGLRPSSTGAATHTLMIGGTTDQLTRVTWRDAEISGDNGSGSQAGSALLLKSLINGTFDNCSVRDGIVTVDIRPEEGPSVSTTHFITPFVRNHLNIQAARAWSLIRGGSDTNYLTAVTVSGGHTNGPLAGYAVELGGVNGVTASYSQHYFDTKPWKGALVNDGNILHGYFATIDPGASGVPVIESTAAVDTDLTRIVAGNWRIGNQQVKYRRALVTGSVAGNVLTVTAITGTIVAADDMDGQGVDHTLGGTNPANDSHITINAFGSGGTSGTGGLGTYQLSNALATLTSREFSIGPVMTAQNEMEWFFYRPSLNSPFVRGDMQFDAPGTTYGAGPKIGPSGTDLISYNRTNFLQAIQFFGGTANAAASLDVNGGTGGFRITALGTVANTDIRFDPKGAGAVRVNGYGLLPVVNTQNIGSSGEPFIDIYAVNALHVTSDGRSKNWATTLADSADKAKYLAASKDIHTKFGFFTWKTGEDEGWHCGNVAQDVIQAFIDQGLEQSLTGPFKHSMFAYDAWDASDDREAGNRYTLSGEFDKFMIWAMGERLNALEA